MDGQRREFVEAQLARRTRCEVVGLAVRNRTPGDAEQTAFLGKLAAWCTSRATELHEPLTRARAPGAETILDVENSVATCRRCHETIHNNPRAALSLGLLRSGRAPQEEA